MEGMKHANVRFSLGVLALMVAALSTFTQAMPKFTGLPPTLEVTGMFPPPDSSSSIGMGSEKTPLTIVFNRPVIPVGADTEGKDAFGHDVVEFVGSSAFPGKVRWVTTSIARFDPDVSWPFLISLQWRINPQLKTYDGIPLQGEYASKTLRITSLGVRVQSVSVTSKEAMKLTNNAWNSQDASEESNVYECPPDGVVTMTFNREVSLSLLAQGLLLSPQQQGQGLENFKCCTDPMSTAEGTDLCACVSFTPTHLQRGQKYSIKIVSGKKLSPLSGYSAQATIAELVGITPFTIPFQNKKLPSFATAQYRRQNLWLKHGVAAGTKAEDFAPFIGVTDLRSNQRVEVELKLIDGNQLQLEGAFQPDNRYKVEAIVPPGTDPETVPRDGYGQPLQHSVGFFFTTKPYYYHAVSSGNGIFPRRPDDFQWREIRANLQNLVGSDEQTSITYVAPDTTARRLGQVVTVLHQNFGSDSPFNALSPVDFPYSRGEGVIEDAVSLKRIAQKSPTDVLNGMFIAVGALNQGFLSRVSSVVFSDLSATLVVDAGVATVWVTRHATGEGSGVAEAEVLIYCHTYSSSLPTLLFQGNTDAQGILVTELDTCLGSLYSFARTQRTRSDPGDIVLIGPVEGGHQGVKWNTKVNLACDRGVYTPDDTVHVTGHIREVHPVSTEVRLPLNVGQVVCLVSWQVDSYTQSRAVVDSAGSFTANFTIPPDARYGSYFVSCRSEREARDGGFGGATFLISDPRPPTVTMEMSVGGTEDQTFTPKAFLHEDDTSLDVLIEAASYLGGGVPNAEVTLTWTIARHTEFNRGFSFTSGNPRFRSHTEDRGPSWTSSVWQPSREAPVSQVDSGFSQQPGSETGIMKLMTDDQGRLRHTLTLSDLTPRSLTDGDSVRLEATWIGPTRERLVKSKELTVRKSEFTVHLGIQPSNPLPGVPFDVGATIQVVEGAQASGTMEVTYRLWKVTDTSAFISRPPLPEEAALHDANTPAPSVIFAPEPDCSECALVEVCNAAVVPVSSIDYSAFDSSCQVTLPALGHFVVVASIDGAGAHASMAVGRTLEEWQSSPARLQESLVVRLDEQHYSLGDEMTISFHNPFAGAKALLRIGSPPMAWEGKHTPPIPQAQSIHELAGPGEVELKAPVTEACIVSCTLTIVLSAPQQPLSSLFPVDVPVSKLTPVLDPVQIAVTVPVTVVWGPSSRDQQTTDLITKVGLMGQPLSALPSLQVNVATDKDVYAPGEEVELTVSLAAANGDALEGEFTVQVVDRAIFDLSPVPQPDLGHRFEAVPRSWTTSRCSDQLRAALSGYEASRAAVLRRLTADPWVRPLWQLRNDFAAEVDMSDEAYFSSYNGYLTPFPGPSVFPAFMDMMAMESMSAPSEDKMMKLSDGNSQRSSSPADSAPVAPPPTGVPVRSSIERTPFFVHTLTAASQQTLKFRLPDNVGTFLVRVVASAVKPKGSNGQTLHFFGSSDKDIVSRRPLTLQSSLPRVARIGDMFDAGVTVRLSSPPELGESVTVEETEDMFGVVVRAYLLTQDQTTCPLRFVDSPFQIASPDSAFVMAAQNELVAQASAMVRVGEDRRVTFRFQASSITMGSAKLRFHAEVEGMAGYEDAVETAIPVKAHQPPVTVGTTISLTAQESGVFWKEGLVLPNALFGVGDLDISASVGHYAAQGALSSGLLPPEDDRPYWFNGKTVMGAMFPLMAFSPYGSKQDPDMRRAAERGYKIGRSRVEQYFTSSAMAFHKVESSVTLDTNLFCVMVNYFGGLLVKSSSRPFGDLVLPKEYEDKCLRGVGEQSQRLKASWTNGFVGWHTVADVFVAGATEFGEYARGQRSIGLESLVSAAAASTDVVLKAKTLAAAVLRGYDDVHTLSEGPLSSWPSRLDASKLQQLYAAIRLRSVIRVQGRSAYFAHADGNPWNPREQSLALIALLLSPAQTDLSPILPKIATHIAASRLRYWSPEAVVSSMFALAVYDIVRGSSTPNLMVGAAVGGRELLRAVFDATGAADITTTAANANSAFEGLDSWRELPLLQSRQRRNTAALSRRATWESLTELRKGQALPPMLFAAIGTGEAVVSTTMTFVPSAVIVPPRYRGIQVTKELFVLDALGKRVKAAHQHVQVGSMVEVIIQVITPDALRDVLITDFLPGGLEPLIPGIDSHSTDNNYCGNRIGGLAPAWWCFNPFSAMETKADVVFWRARHLWAGGHEVSYRATAVTSGVFVLPPAVAESEEQPELMGSSASLQFLVHEEELSDDTVAPLLQEAGIAEPVAELKGCEEACKDGEYCDLSSGTCIADAVNALSMVALGESELLFAGFDKGSGGGVEEGTTGHDSNQQPPGGVGDVEQPEDTAWIIPVAAAGGVLCLAVAAGVVVVRYRRQRVINRLTQPKSLDNPAMLESTAMSEEHEIRDYTGGSIIRKSRVYT